jgi:hypothetical protein
MATANSELTHKRVHVVELTEEETKLAIATAAAATIKCSPPKIGRTGVSYEVEMTVSKGHLPIAKVTIVEDFAAQPEARING